jgi:hypothetical protein
LNPTAIASVGAGIGFPAFFSSIALATRIASSSVFLGNVQGVPFALDEVWSDFLRDRVRFRFDEAPAGFSIPSVITGVASASIREHITNTVTHGSIHRHLQPKEGKVWYLFQQSN